MTTNEKMRALLAVDPDTKLLFSDCTGKWYISGNIGITTDGYSISSPTEHRATPDEAVDAMFYRVFNLKPLERLVVNGHRLGDK